MEEGDDFLEMPGDGKKQTPMSARSMFGWQFGGLVVLAVIWALTRLLTNFFESDDFQPETIDTQVSFAMAALSAIVTMCILGAGGTGSIRYGLPSAAITMVVLTVAFYIL